ncbi:hypothetical protein [Arthrobacter sp. UYEF36]|uniref:hypothetical protein n=1 Tax=Arthrobacter sp. UYEF36 TaxID=1756366 RepID=UPI0033993A52
MAETPKQLQWQELAARIFETPGASETLATADSLDAVIKSIDTDPAYAKDLNVSKHGRAFLLGASAALRAAVSAQINAADYAPPGPGEPVPGS